MSSIGADKDISSSKVDPLSSDVKKDKPAADLQDGGVVGTDETIDQARVDPVGGRGQYQNPASHANTGGVIGRDDTVAGAKIDPLSSNVLSQKAKGGLEDEDVDASRVAPLGEVREEVPKRQ